MALTYYIYLLARPGQKPKNNREVYFPDEDFKKQGIYISGDVSLPYIESINPGMLERTWAHLRSFSDMITRECKPNMSIDDLARFILDRIPYYFIRPSHHGFTNAELKKIAKVALDFYDATKHFNIHLSVPDDLTRLKWHTDLLSVLDETPYHCGTLPLNSDIKYVCRSGSEELLYSLEAYLSKAGFEGVLVARDSSLPPPTVEEICRRIDGCYRILSFYTRLTDPDAIRQWAADQVGTSAQNVSFINY